MGSSPRRALRFAQWLALLPFRLHRQPPRG